MAPGRCGGTLQLGHGQPQQRGGHEKRSQHAVMLMLGVATPRASSPPPISHTAPGCSDGTGASSGLSKPGGRGERVAGATFCAPSSSLSAQASLPLPLPLPLQAARPERHAPARGRLRSGGPIRAQDVCAVVCAPCAPTGYGARPWMDAHS